MNLDSARQSTIEACGPNDEAIVKTMAEKEDRLGKAAASPNSQNLTERGTNQLEQGAELEPKGKGAKSNEQKFVNTLLAFRT